MGDQQLYKTNHVAHSGENLFYQQPPLGVHGGLNHNYGNTVTGAGMDAPQASPISPHFPQDTRDGLGLPVGSKSLGQVDTSRQGGWGGHAGPGNHVQLRGNLTNSNMMWGAPAQAEPADGYQYTYSQASEIRTQKLTSGVLHKLDSFTQVFANQNLRIQVNNMAQVLHTQSAVMDGAPDSALRQLLSQKPMEPPAPSVPARYQQVPQQPHPGFTGGLSKPALQVGQHPSQGHLYYDYQQPLAQMPVQGGQPLQGPQMLSQHMQQMQQHQYYSPQQQQQQGGQQRMPTQEMQPQLQIRPPQLQQQQQQLQQRQGSMQIPQYYQSPPMMQHLQEQQQQQMHLQPPSYHRDPHQYTPEQAHAVQLIQLGSMPQYYYQEPQQPYSHPLYQQSHLSQHQQREDSQPKTYSSDRPVQAMQSSHGDLGPSDTGMGDPASLDLNRVSSALPHRPLMSPSGIHLNNVGPQHQQLSPSAMWPQMHLPDGRAQPGSPESSGQPKGVFGEQIDAKNKLTCSICLKEFKSLPALNGHMRSHGGMRASPSLKQEEGEKAPPPQPQPLPPPLPPQLPPEAESLTPMVMPVSVPVKLLVPKPSSKSFANSVVAAPSARDKPASSMSDDEMPVLVRMTLSPPHSPQGAVPCTPAEIPRKHQPGVAKAEESHKPAPEKEKKKFRHRPEPLFIPPPPSYNPNPASYSGATLYQSQLRSPRVLGDHLLLDPTHELPAYTPPPMLSPVRQGSGLFSNVLLAGQGPGAHPQLPLTPLTPTPRVLLCRSNSIDGSNVTVTPGPGEQTIDVEPRINIGLRFQAEIPELQDVSAVAQDTHKATLVWKPWPELENHDLQQRVEHLLNLCCSSALPGGGTNSEFALHCLFEAKGDVMAALEMLLLRKPVRLKCHPLANYHYAGSDKWTSLERKLFNKALATYSKDFIFVQKMVKSKTVAQCVEYYYTWKKIMRLGRKHRTRLTELIDDSVTSEEEDELEEEEEDQEEDRKSTREEESEVPKSPEPQPGPVLAPAEGPPLQALSQPSGSFICEMPNCGADCRCHVTPFLPQVFSSRQALNGHARIHGGTNQVTKARGAVPPGKQKPGSAQSGYCSVKSSPSHSTTSGETDPTTVFPCKECGKVFFKIKSRNAHMKTHRQQEEQQRQKAQKAAFAAEMAATIERTTGPAGAPGLLPLDQLSLIKPIKDVDILDDDVVQQLGGVMEEAEVVDTDLLLDDQDSVLLQGDTEL
ncbi:transcriptional-regulating factor 1 isoform X1 [Phyllostomus hastatus]|uniref:transcriptional-regulating factor 1 isoform X1 n=1 Tax=Phyllostomus hastatus TaxID=9423 RepID=UPI001E6827D3|nr:transcriptional-regulating factor 1 isoform X1 [Phyllostomus hastatus]XP_045699118.1 transcriptional-regulating factor 1 isoform X1 [Phyllostomus hastatus]XP_045699119.1 transcriptional-regulating factor 1 isoform X1 [Phyllostomus hastatus]XP_045699120.1 transcriptional-regulating factor 1 isoform X1 [Phyllostomus hastatus]XP_045699121.1 transcriptional-regulating factor 1 isoform X1 [Phyllostomus hastatus]XP_045699122.1 transcriptional-regulating factor 1 isoform X1 [Phyllostomus hastatus]